MLNYSQTMTFSILVLTTIHFGVHPSFHTVATLLAALPNTFVDIAIVVVHSTMSFFSSFNILAFVFASVVPHVCTVTVFLAILPLALVAISVDEDQNTAAVLLAITELTFVDGLVGVHEPATTVSTAVLPTALVAIAVWCLVQTELSTGADQIAQRKLCDAGVLCCVVLILRHPVFAVRSTRRGAGAHRRETVAHEFSGRRRSTDRLVHGCIDRLRVVATRRGNTRNMRAERTTIPQLVPLLSTVCLNKHTGTVFSAIQETTTEAFSADVVVGAATSAFVVQKVALVCVAGGLPLEHADTAALIVVKVSDVAVAVAEHQLTFAVSLTLKELAFVNVTIVVVVDSDAVSIAFVEFAQIAITIQVAVNTFASACVVLELTFVHLTISPGEHTSTDPRVRLPFTHVAVTTHPVEGPITTAAILAEFSLIALAFRPQKGAATMLLVI
mmetsp:Transcript_17784/g.45278  ORF Transcript_17784/g.45278 Transcript_17784/m.45278 type:complete len:443 (+) Transcript_17784:399-1727(+)